MVGVGGLQPAEELQRPNNKHFGAVEERERKKEKHLRTTFYYSFFWSPDPHRTHWIFIVESLKPTDLQFLTLIIPQKEDSGIFRITTHCFGGFFAVKNEYYNI